MLEEILVDKVTDRLHNPLKGGGGGPNATPTVQPSTAPQRDTPRPLPTIIGIE